MKFIFKNDNNKVKIKDLTDKEDIKLKKILDTKFQNYDKHSQRALLFTFLEKFIEFDYEKKENKLIYKTKENIFKYLK